MTESKTSRVRLNKLETAVFESDGVVANSFYVPIDPISSLNLSGVGDVVMRDDGKWTLTGSLIGTNGLISNPLMKNNIREYFLDNLHVEEQTKVVLDGGARLDCVVDQSAKSISELPKSISCLEVKACTAPDSHLIECTGNWESLQKLDKLAVIFKGMRTSEKLCIFIRNHLADFALVTEAFKTTTNFVAFTSDGEPPDFTVNIDNQNPPISSDDAYKQLAKDIKSKSPKSELQVSVEPFVPFVRLWKIKPMWLSDGELKEEAIFVSNNSRGLPTFGRDKVVKPVDSVDIKTLQPELHRKL